jgi:deoxyribose-phosphate aldolase
MQKKYARILAACDHTLLQPHATWEDIRQLCDEALEYRTASVCIPPCFVREAREYVGNDLKICTVIGFPHGNSTTSSKVFEARDAIENGADEIDMVINIGMLKAGRPDYVREEIRAVKETVGMRVLKVIVETCMLTEAEKILMCRVISQSGADYIKTSTGFAEAGATFEDVALFAEYVGPHVKIKAAGGIRTLEDAEKFLSLGASRLGTSRIVKLVKEQ